MLVQEVLVLIMEVPEEEMDQIHLHLPLQRLVVVVLEVKVHLAQGIPVAVAEAVCEVIQVGLELQAKVLLEVLM
jgi:hypothetical protein